MPRDSAILCLLALSLLAGSCGDDDGAGTTTTPTSSSTAVEAEEPAAEVWYTDRERGLLARWDMATYTCLGVAPIGEMANLLEAGLGWVWVTDCPGGRLVRVDSETGEVTGSLDLGGCPSDLLLVEGLVWVAVPDTGSVLAIDPATGETVSEISGPDDPILLLAEGSGLLATAHEWYRVPIDTLLQGEVLWDEWLEENPEEGDLSFLDWTALPHLPTSVGVLASGPGAAVLDTSDPAYPMIVYAMGSDGRLSKLADLTGYYNHLAAVGSYLVATSGSLPYAQVLDPRTPGNVVQIPLQSPGAGRAGPPPPGEDPFGSWVWLTERDLDWASLTAFNVNNPPAQTPQPVVEPKCGYQGIALRGNYAVVLGAADAAAQVAAAQAADIEHPGSRFPWDPLPPSGQNLGWLGPNFRECSAGFDASTGEVVQVRAVVSAPGATVTLRIEGSDGVPLTWSKVSDEQGAAQFDNIPLESFRVMEPAVRLYFTTGASTCMAIVELY